MKAAELAKAAKKVTDKRAAALPDGSMPTIGTVWPGTEARAKAGGAGGAARGDGKSAAGKGGATKAAGAAKAAKAATKATKTAKATKAAEEPQKSGKVQKAQKAGKADKSQSAGKPEKAKKPGKAEKAQKAGKAEKAQKADQAQKAKKPGKASKAAVKAVAGVKAAATKSVTAGKGKSAKKAKKAEKPTIPPDSRWATRDRGLRKAINEATAEIMTAPLEVDAGGAASKAGKADGKTKRRRRSAPPPPAANEPMAFINFVGSYPLGSELEGEVTSFTSHGAMVEVHMPDDLSLFCYIPLAGLGRPPPRKAREVLKRGEHREFVLVGLDPPRRVAELALPGLAERAGQGSRHRSR